MSEIHTASNTQRQSQDGIDRLAVIRGAAPRIQNEPRTDTASNTLRPKPIPAQSSVGSSPTVKNPVSKLVFTASTMNPGMNSGACRFHQPAGGKTGGTKLASSS